MSFAVAMDDAMYCRMMAMMMMMMMMMMTMLFV